MLNFRSVIVGLVCSSISWSVASVRAEPLVDQAQLEAAGLTKYWQAQLPLAPGDHIAAAYLVDEALYIVSETGTLFSLLADMGLLRWVQKVADRDYRVNRPAHMWTGDGSGAVIVQASTGLALFDRFTGESISRLAKEHASAGGPVIGAWSTLFVSGREGLFRAIELGRTPSDEPMVRWRVRLDGLVAVAPVIYGDGKLLMATQAGTVYSCGAADKSIDWVFRTGGPIVADPVIDGTGIYVASKDRSLYKLDRDHGAALWRRRLPVPLVDAPVAIGDTVFQGESRLGLVALDASTGEVRWERGDSRQFVARLHDRDVLWAGHGVLQFVELNTGRLTSTVTAPSAIGAVTNADHDAVILLGGSGEVFCARPAGVPYLRLQRVKAARSQLNLPPLQATNSKIAAEVQPSTVSPNQVSDPLRSSRDPGR